MTCPITDCGVEAHYIAHLGAPGVGQAWECDKGHNLVMLAGSLYEDEGQFISRDGG